MFDRANPSNPSGPLWDLGPSVLSWGFPPCKISSRALLACIKISYTRYVIHWRVVGHMSRSLVVVLVVYLNRPHGTEPPVGNPHNSGDVIQYVATPRLTASRWLCSQVLLWTTVTLRGANDQEECVPCPFPRILDDASGQAGGTMSWLGESSGRRAAKRSRPMHRRSVAFCLPPPSPEIYELW